MRTFYARHRRALATIAVAATLDGLGAVGFALVERVSIPLGFYWAVTTATTVGYGDIAPHTAAGHVIAVAVMLTVVPLFAATFSLFTSGLTADHVEKHSAITHSLLGHIIRYHPDIPAFVNRDEAGKFTKKS